MSNTTARKTHTPNRASRANRSAVVGVSYQLNPRVEPEEGARTRIGRGQQKLDCPPINPLWGQKKLESRGPNNLP
jgi:hypothetical protein